MIRILLNYIGVAAIAIWLFCLTAKHESQKDVDTWSHNICGYTVGTAIGHAQRNSDQMPLKNSGFALLWRPDNLESAVAKNVEDSEKKSHPWSPDQPPPGGMPLTTGADQFGHFLFIPARDYVAHSLEHPEEGVGHEYLLKIITAKYRILLAEGHSRKEALQFVHNAMQALEWDLEGTLSP